MGGAECRGPKLYNNAAENTMESKAVNSIPLWLLPLFLLEFLSWLYLVDGL